MLKKTCHPAMKINIIMVSQGQLTQEIANNCTTKPTNNLFLCRFSIGEEVAVEIDGAKRLLHARIHSAGHLLDSAFSNIGVTDLEPTKVRLYST